MHPTSTQYIHSLLHHLEEIGNSTDSNTISEKVSESPILFTKALLKVNLDYTPVSIRRLDKLFSRLSEKYTMEQLLSAEGGERFFLLVAGYIGNYVAKQVGLPIVWHDYQETEQWRDTNYQASNAMMNKPFPQDFAFSISATIGTDFFCLPLMGVHRAMLGQETIKSFITAVKDSVYEETPINPKQDANKLCQDLLLMVQTGRLMNHRLKFYDFLKEITFDYSLNSLQQLDDALLAIKAYIRQHNQGYQQLVVQPAFHRLVFFLGFYIGISSAKLANTSTNWMNHQQAQAMIPYDFPFCLEHASVQVFGNNFRIPILTINNRLFELTSDYSDSVFVYATDVMQENAGTLHSYPFVEKAVINNTENELILPETWQKAMEKAGFLLSSSLVNLLNGGYADDYIIPSVYDYDDLNDVYYISSYDSEDAIELVYQHLADNPKNSPFVVAIYQGYADLPTGRMDGLVIEVRGFENPDKVYFDDEMGIDDLDNIDDYLDGSDNMDTGEMDNDMDNLVAQFVLPYRQPSHDFGLAIYPLVTNQTLKQSQLQALANALYKGAIGYKSLFIDKHLWADYYLTDFDLWQWTPAYRKHSYLDRITIIDEQIEVFSVEEQIQNDLQEKPQDIVQNESADQLQKLEQKESSPNSLEGNNTGRRMPPALQTPFHTVFQTRFYTSTPMCKQAVPYKTACSSNKFNQLLKNPQDNPYDNSSSTSSDNPVKNPYSNPYPDFVVKFW